MLPVQVISGEEKKTNELLLEFFPAFEDILADVATLLLVDVPLVVEETVAFAEAPRALVAREAPLVLVKDPDVPWKIIGTIRICPERDREKERERERARPSQPSLHSCENWVEAKLGHGLSMCILRSQWPGVAERVKKLFDEDRWRWVKVKAMQRRLRHYLHFLNRHNQLVKYL